MNRWYLAGQACSFFVEFKKDGEFVQPDSASIKLTIRDNSGTPISGYNAASQADTALTSLLLTIPSNVNNISSGRETRYVQLDFTSAGVPCNFRSSYKLSAFLPISASPEDVRNILGAREKEVKNEEVELYEAYYQLLRTNSTLTASLIATGDAAMYANRAVALKAALILLPSMPVRALKEETLNNSSAIRATIDWGALRAAIESELSTVLANMAATEDPVLAFVSIFALTFPVDPVTNV